MWSILSHYKLPLWAESCADPRKPQANIVNCPVTTAGDSQSEATSCEQQLTQSYTFVNPCYVHHKTKLQKRLCQICEAVNPIQKWKLHHNHGSCTVCSGVHALQTSAAFYQPAGSPLFPIIQLHDAVKAERVNMLFIAFFSHSIMWYFIEEVSTLVLDSPHCLHSACG